MTRKNTPGKKRQDDHTALATASDSSTSPQLFLKEYQELCDKHALFLHPTIELVNQDNGTQSLRAAFELKKQSPKRIPTAVG